MGARVVTVFFLALLHWNTHLVTFRYYRRRIVSFVYCVRHVKSLNHSAVCMNVCFGADHRCLGDTLGWCRTPLRDTPGDTDTCYSPVNPGRVHGYSGVDTSTVGIGKLCTMQSTLSYFRRFRSAARTEKSDLCYCRLACLYL